jgi:hypothetical protein
MNNLYNQLMFLIFFKVFKKLILLNRSVLNCKEILNKNQIENILF